MKKRLSVALSMLFTLMVLAMACRGNEALTFEKLFADPEAYDGRTVLLEGYYFHGWETSVLCERLEASGLAEGHLVPKGSLIWVDGGIPQEVFDRLQTQETMGPLERFGKVRVKGEFHYGEDYGHLGGYDAQITPLETVLLEP